MPTIVVGLAVFFVSGAASTLCPSNIVAVNVTSTADAQNLTDALACTGAGNFDITWYPSVSIEQTIDVSNEKDVTVTGIGLPIIRGALYDDIGDYTTSDGGRGTGIFKVSNGSTLRLSHLVLEGGNEDNGGAIHLDLDSSLVVFNCAFTNNNASRGGEIPLL